MADINSSQAFGAITGSAIALGTGAGSVSSLMLGAMTGRAVAIGTNVYRGTATSWDHRFWDDRRFGVEDCFWNDGHLSWEQD